MSYILQINFKLQNSVEEIAQQVDSLANVIACVPGLRWKIWLMDELANHAGGIYLFESLAAAKAYLEGDIAQAIQNDPDFTDFEVKLSPVWSAPTAVTASTNLLVR